MIKNIEELLGELEKLQTHEEKIKFVTMFLLKNLKYDYAKIFAAGYTAGTVIEINPKLKPEVNPLLTEGSEGIVLSQALVSGGTHVFKEIIDIKDKNTGDYNGFISELRTYIDSELRGRIENDAIVNETIEILMKKITNDLTQKMEIPTQNGVRFVNRDISMILIDYIRRADANFPAEFENGLLAKGVCKDYADYLMAVLGKVGIKVHRLDGIIELKHAWNLVKVGEEYKCIDLTRGIFARDGYKSVPKSQRPEDWLFTDLETMFEMEPTRSITAINNKPLITPITASNYDSVKFRKIMQQFDKTTNKDTVEFDD